MKTKLLISSMLMTAFLTSCTDQRTPEEQEERVEQIRQQGAELQESVREMQPELDAEAQETIDRVERRAEKNSD